MKIGRRLIATLAIAATASSAAGQEYRYAIIRLPSLDESLATDVARGINSLGDVVGGAAMDSKWSSRPVVWPGSGGVIDLGTLGGDVASASSINESGEIVGASGFEPGGSIFVGHAFLWQDGEMTDLGTLGGESSSTQAINNMGQVVGQSEYEFGNHANRGCLWENGEIIALLAPREGRYSASANDINDLGQIVGAALGSESQATATLWIDREPIDLGSLAGEGSSAFAINNLGHVVGQSRAANGNTHAVVWVDQQVIDIHASQYGRYSWGQDISNADQVVGAIGNQLTTRQMFIREFGEPMRLLKDLTPPRTRERWRFDRGHINDAGQICITANITNTLDLYAVLLTPVSPSMTLASPSPGTAGTNNTLTVTDVTPGARVTFLYSRHGGGTRIPGCDLQQNALQLDNPTVIGTAIANQQGVATITRPVPLIARGQTILFQAVVQGECAISQLVVWRFE